MNEELENSYRHLLEIIKAEARGKEVVMPDIIRHFVPMFSETRSVSFSKKIKKLLSFSDKNNKINSIDDLLHELENSNIISQTNISSLSTVIDKFENEILKLHFKKHEDLLERSTHVPVEQINKPEKIKEEVRELLCHSISKKWMELGRQLGITDESLEQIEHKYEDFWRRTSKVLDYLEITTPTSEQGPLLYKALVAIKRKDLAEKTQPFFE